MLNHAPHTNSTRVENRRTTDGVGFHRSAPRSWLRPGPSCRPRGVKFRSFGSGRALHDDAIRIRLRPAAIQYDRPMTGYAAPLTSDAAAFIEGSVSIIAGTVFYVLIIFAVSLSMPAMDSSTARTTFFASRPKYSYTFS